jgi:hypothetical protein
MLENRKAKPERVGTPRLRAMPALLLLAVACSKTEAPSAATNTRSPADGDLLADTAEASGAKSKGAVSHCPPELPEALNPPADATLELGLPAAGVQIYRCNAAAANQAPAWALEAPHAVLGSGKDTVIHFAGPSWQAVDGSKVTAAARLASAPSPEASAVPWLLLGATPAAADGALGDITHIQRLGTVGGVAPPTGCDASHVGTQVLVPYRADYFFYHTAKAGEAVRQCRSQGHDNQGHDKKPKSS